MKFFSSFVASLALAGCMTSVGADTSATPLTVSGRYQYIDGDRLIWNCQPNRECVDTLIRDARLQAEIENSSDMAMTLRVERVPACGPRSTQVACLQSSGDTVLRILEWLEVRGRSN